MQNTPEPSPNEAFRLNAYPAQASLTVKNFAQQLYSLDVSKDAARLCLLNFLINFYEPQAAIDAQIFEHFYMQALGFSFWQENWEHLTSQVKICVGQIEKRMRTSFIPGEWLNGENLQPVIIQKNENLTKLIYKFLETTMNSASQFKIIKATDEYWLAIILDEKQKLSVKIFNNIFVLAGSDLLPSSQGFQISYNADLQLKENFYQHIPVGLHTSTRFRMTERGVVGRTLRGYTFQKLEDLNGGALSQYPNVFFQFKKFEQHYINLKTDAFYNEIISALEFATDALQKSDVNISRSSRVYSQVQSTLQKAKQAMEAIFSNDKMLSLLISNLEKTLALKNIYESSQFMDV